MEPKILIVDDDTIVSDVLAEFLTRSGFLVIQTTSAEKAETILKNEEFNIVITDIKLPGKDGIQFTKDIKEKYNLEVIVITGHSSEYLYEDVIKIGASDLIFKPIRFEELQIRITRTLRERRLKIERDQMIQELKMLSIKDSLTDLYNARHFYAKLTNEIKRTERYSHPLSLIFIDIDKLKVINDTYGHIIGDEAIALVAKKIDASLRSEDTAYRFAGDEFTVILPETTSKEAFVVADRIRSELQKVSIVVKDKEISDITVSMGIAEYQRNEEINQFIHRSDKEMYNSKGKGGNKISVATRVKAISSGLNLVSSHNIS
ncbi:diguanylate cyclase [Thermodesulfobacteriota bacterium]